MNAVDTKVVQSYRRSSYFTDANTGCSDARNLTYPGPVGGRPWTVERGIRAAARGAAAGSGCAVADDSVASFVLEARQEAAKQKKPIFIWAMDGHPLGCT